MNEKKKSGILKRSGCYLVQFWEKLRQKNAATIINCHENTDEKKNEIIIARTTHINSTLCV